MIVDAPATGHGVGILRTPQTFAEIARVGPIAAQGRTIAATIDDRSFTAVIAVATAEEMPVNETLALREALAATGSTLDAVILNAAVPAAVRRRRRGGAERRAGEHATRRWRAPRCAQLCPSTPARRRNAISRAGSASSSASS